MAYIIDGPRITRHISLSPKEDSILRNRADQAGMGICPYIRAQALDGKVIQFDWKAIQKSQRSIDRLSASVARLTHSQNPRRPVSDPDLDAIRDMMSQILEHQATILETLRTGA